MKKTTQALIFCSAMLILPATLVAQRPGGKASAPVVSLGEVVTAEDVETRNYTGLIVSQSVVQIVPRVSGEILKVGFQDGDYVRNGQVLYSLDPIRYEAGVKGAEAKIAECKAKLQYAQTNFDRGQTLYEKQAASKDTMENRRAVLEAYQAELLAAESELITARDDLKNTSITAPIDGLAGVTAYTRGNYITPNSGVLVTIIQVKPIRVRFSISTADYLSSYGSLENLTETASVRVKLSDGTLYPVDGRIKFLNNEVNSRTDAIQIYAEFDNPDMKLLPGSTVSVALAKKKGHSLPAIPPSAMVHDSSGAYVYVADASNKVSKRYIVPGNSTETLQFVKSGLSKGELVVTEGTHKVIDGSSIEPAAKE